MLTLDPTFGSFIDATATVGPHGGKTTVSATCGENLGEAVLNVNLIGDVIQPGTPAGAPGMFGAATAGTDTARTAVARNKLTGMLDPSSPPMWLPGQDMRADNISPYWSVPAGLQ